MVSIEDFTQLAINLATAWAEATLPTKEMRVLDRIKRRQAQFPFQFSIIPKQTLDIWIK